MPRDHDLPDASYEEVNSKLNEGLESCRSVVANYRVLLTSHDADAANDDDSDELESARAPAD